MLMVLELKCLSRSTARCSLAAIAGHPCLLLDALDQQTRGGFSWFRSAAARFGTAPPFPRRRATAAAGRKVLVDRPCRLRPQAWVSGPSIAIARLSGREARRTKRQSRRRTARPLSMRQARGLRTIAARRSARRSARKGKRDGRNPITAG